VVGYRCRCLLAAASFVSPTARPGYEANET
jgi:hypothetical protein